MARLVMKFGGTSVADIDRIRNVARHVKREVDAGHEVAVVVSAMAGTTNQLVAWAREAAPLHDAREYDAVVASGEQVTAGLLAIVLEGMGVNARSWQGWQLPILHLERARLGAHRGHQRRGADQALPRARRGRGRSRAFRALHKETGRITTLGRGGSDTSAVAIAAAIRADRCDIYTDVDGVYTTDPRVVPRAQRLEKIAFEEMLELASLGAKVMQVRSVELGMVHNVRIFVRSSFEKPEDIDPMSNHPPGTLICDESEIMEQQVVTGIAFSKDEAQISIRHVPDKPGVAAAIFGPLAEANINVDMIVQNVSADGATTDLTFTVPSSDYERANAVLEKSKAAIGYDHARRLDRCRQGVGDRHRHAQPCGRRRAGLQGAGRAADQHPGDHHVGDQVLAADRRRATPSLRCARCTACMGWISDAESSSRPSDSEGRIHNHTASLLYATHSWLSDPGLPASPALAGMTIERKMPLPPLSYAQRFEDFHLWRCLGDSRTASMSTSAPGLRSTTTSRLRSISPAGAASAVEPNPALAALGRAVRPHDHLYEGLCGAADGRSDALSPARIPRPLDHDRRARADRRERSQPQRRDADPADDHARGAVRTARACDVSNSSRSMSKAPRPTCCAARISHASAPR